MRFTGKIILNIRLLLLFTPTGVTKHKVIGNKSRFNHPKSMKHAHFVSVHLRRWEHTGCSLGYSGQ